MVNGTQPDTLAGDAGPEVISASQWLLANWIRVAGILMIVAQIWWMGVFLTHSYFRLDDFYFIDRGLHSGLTWKYLMWVNAGKLTPIGFAISWVLDRVSPMDWTLASTVTLAMLACAGLALLRLLRTLFGDHPGVLLLMLIYLFSPLSFPGLSWWSVTLELLPLEIAMFCAINSHVRYVRTGRFKYAVHTTAWLAVGMAASIKGAGVPLLLFAITSAWLMHGTWLQAARRTLREHWPAWLTYAVLLVVYLGIYVAALRTSTGAKPARPGAFSGVIAYMQELVVKTFVPGLLGGPWQWFAPADWTSAPNTPGEYGLAMPPAALVTIAWVVAAVIILISFWRQPRAWRSWAIVLAWLLVMDSIPELLGRATVLSPSLLGMETRYVIDAVGVLVICAGLCFLPQVGLQAEAGRWATRARLPDSVRSLVPRWAPAGIVGAFVAAVLLGSVVSYHDYLASTSNYAQRSYFATAKAALAETPSGTVIVNEQVPTYATDNFFGFAGEAQLLAPLQPTTGYVAPFVNNVAAGTWDELKMFNFFGQLVQASVVGVKSVPASGLCFPVGKTGVVLVKLPALPDSPTELRFGYLDGNGGQIVVSYAGHSQLFQMLKGLNQGFIPVGGSAQVVTFTGATRGLCVGDVEVGNLWPSSTGPVVPVQTVAG